MLAILPTGGGAYSGGSAYVNRECRQKHEVSQQLAYVTLPLGAASSDRDLA